MVRGDGELRLAVAPGAEPGGSRWGRSSRRAGVWSLPLAVGARPPEACSSAPIIPLRGAVRPAVRRPAISAGALIAVASAIVLVVPSGGAGLAVGRPRGPVRHLCRRWGTTVLPGLRRTHQRRRRLANHVGGRALWRRGFPLSSPLGGRRVFGAAV